MISSDSIYEKNVFVRKRKKSDQIYLILLTELFQLDQIAEQIWDLINGKYSIYEIAIAISELNSSIDIAEIYEIVASNINFLLSKGLVNQHG